MNNKVKYIIFGGIAFLVIALLLGFLFGRQVGIPGRQPVLQFWGVFDDASAFSPFIEKFQKQFKVGVEYTKIPAEIYEETLVNAFAAGRGPDIFMFHSTWAPRHWDKVNPAPSKLISPKNFRDAFVDVAYEDFVFGSTIYAMPLYVDTLALYYNRNVLQSAGIATPLKTWTEFMDAVSKVTKVDEAGNILRAGAAIGTSQNVNRAQDILALLMMQSGVQIADRTTGAVNLDQSLLIDNESYPAGQRALEFYADFSNPRKKVYTWSPKQSLSLDAFMQGDVSMMFNYAHQISNIKAKAPYLDFGVYPMPQISDDQKVNYANFWGVTVSRFSRNASSAWNFVSYLISRENSLQYLKATQKPPARRDLISVFSDDPLISVFAEQGLTARSFLQKDAREVAKIFNEMIDVVVSGQKDAKTAVEEAQSKMTAIYSR